MREEGRESGKNRASSWRKNITGTHHETRVTSDVGPLWVLQEILWIDIKLFFQIQSFFVFFCLKLIVKLWIKLHRSVLFSLHSERPCVFRPLWTNFWYKHICILFETVFLLSRPWPHELLPTTDGWLSCCTNSIYSQWGSFGSKQKWVWEGVWIWDIRVCG